MNQAHPSAEDRPLLPAQGWNTWNTRSVLSHVLMPDAFAIDLSFRHYGLLATLRNASFGVKEQTATAGVRLHPGNLPATRVGVRPGRHAYDASYTCVTVLLGEVVITVETARLANNDLAILVQPTASAYRPAALVLEAGYLWNRAGGVEQVSAQLLRATGPAGAILLHATAPAEPDPNAGHRSPYWVFPLREALGFSSGAALPLAELRKKIAAARDREAASHAGHGPLAEVHAAAQAALAWNTTYDPAFDRVITTPSRPWNVLRQGYGIFCWDSFFFAWLMAGDRPDLARNCVREVLREMIDGQFVPNVVNGSGRRSWDRSQPPVGGICVLALHETSPDLAFLGQVWPSLLAWNRWWANRRRNPAGLLSWGSDPFSPKIGDPAERLQPGTRQGAALESGMDNSPMYDDVPFDAATHLMALSDVGLVSLYALDCQALARLAQELGFREDAAELAARAGEFGRGLQDLWNSPAGIFQNRRTDTGKFSPRLSPTLFYPLLAGAADAAQIASLVDGYLLNENKFWGDWVLPSISRDDPAFAEQSYWRGCIWAPLNFLVYLGLKRAGRNDAARALADRSLRLFEENWTQHGAILENFSALNGSRPNPEFSDPLCTWTGLLVLLNLIEHGKLPLPSLLRPAGGA